VNAGFYALPSRRGAQLVVDAGPLGTQSGGHGHADALSICLQTNGYGLLIDPGTYQYVEHDRDFFRGTSMHNTLRVDGTNQAEPATPFSWRTLTKSKAERWIQGKNFDLLVASHDGYQRLEPPVTHRRWVFSLKNGIYLVRDLVTGRGRRRIDIAWHLGQDLQLTDGVFRLQGASQGVALALLPVQGHGWAEEVRRESCSPVYGQKAPMTTINFSAELALPAEFAVLLVTLEGIRRGTTSFTRIESATTDSDVIGYRYAEEGAEHSFIFGEPGKSWRMSSCSSDAEVVCVNRTPERGDEQLILCGGSYARVDGGAELRCARPVEWAELTLRAGNRDIFSSDMSAVEIKITG
jgi:hypothetical protein